MLDMNGIYKVFLDGNLILEQENKLTLLGRSNALKTMLGLTQSFASSLGIGISDKTNGTSTFVGMTDLDFCVGKYPIVSSSLGQNSNSEDALIFTARITDPSRYIIKELGLYSNKLTGSVESTTDVLFDFESGDPLKEVIGQAPYYIDDTEKPTGAATFINTTDPTYGSYIRVGSYALRLEGSNKEVYFDDYATDLSSIAPYDEIVVAAYFVSNNAIVLKFTDEKGEFSNYTFSPGGTGYKILSLTKTAGSNSAVDWSNIVKITITNPNSNVITILDGVRVRKNKPVDSNDGLVSRAVLSNPITKDFGSVIDIQYVLTMKMET